MNGHHFVSYYNCGAHVAAQCRCPGPKQKEVTNTPCPVCVGAQSASARAEDEVAALRKRVEELEGLLGQCAKDWGEARDLGQQHLDRSEKAERERDEAMASLDAELERRKYEPVCACMVDHPGDVCGVHSPIVAKLQADLDAALAERDKFASKAVEMELLWSGTNSDLEELERDVEALAVVAGGDPWPQRPEHQKAWDRIRSRALLEKRRERG